MKTEEERAVQGKGTTDQWMPVGEWFPLPLSYLSLFLNPSFYDSLRLCSSSPPFSLSLSLSLSLSRDFPFYSVISPLKRPQNLSLKPSSLALALALK